MLPEERRTQLDGIVQKMIANKESDSNIKFVVDDFKAKYSTKKETKKEKGYLSRIGSQYKQAGEDIVSGIKTGAEQIQQGDILKGIRTAGLRTVGGVSGAAFAPITSALEPIIKPVIETAMEVPVIQQLTQKATELSQKYPEQAKDIQNLVDIASLGLGSPVQKTISKTSGIAGDIVTGTGRITKATGRKLAESAIRPTQQEAQKILNYEAKNVLKDRIKSAVKGEIIDAKPITRGTTAFEKGIAGTEKMIGVQAKRETSNLWKNTIEPALKASKEVITKDELFAPIVKRIKSITDPILKQQYDDAFKSIQEAYKKSSTWTLEQAQKLKEDLAQFIPEKAYQGKPIANELKALKADMADAIRQKIYSSFKDTNIRKSYIDYGNLKNLEKIGVKAISDGGKLGGFGGFWTSLYDSAVTPIKTVGGQVLYRVGNKIEFVGEKGLKTFSQFLKSKGYTIKK